MKRVIDFLISILATILLMPLMIIIALLVLFSDFKEILYIQERIGINGKKFRLIKFRTMKAGSDRARLITLGSTDNRITRIGRVLRKYKLDELPQLFNVLKGDMSIVGPRPEVAKYVDLYTNEQKKVLSVKPGITDYASIYYIDENEILARSDDPEKTYIEVLLPHKVELNMIYVNNPSLKNYFEIIFKTLVKIIF